MLKARTQYLRKPERTLFCDVYLRFPPAAHFHAVSAFSLFRVVCAVALLCAVCIVRWIAVIAVIAVGSYQKCRWWWWSSLFV